MSYDGPDRRSSGREELVTAIAYAVRTEIAGLTVPEEIHREHHEFIKAWIKKQKDKEERSEKIKTQVGGWAIVTLLGSIGTATYHGFQYLRDHLK